MTWQFFEYISRLRARKGNPERVGGEFFGAASGLLKRDKKLSLYPFTPGRN